MGKKFKVEMITERKIIVVQPGMLFTSPGRIEVDVCLKCGAVVFDPIQHDTWHRTAERAVAALATHQRSQPQMIDPSSVPPLDACTCSGRGRPCYACSTVGTDLENGSRDDG
jgi:hypothetical protein